MSVFECVLNAGAGVGECPMRHRQEQCLYWVDGWQVARFDPDGKLERVLSIPVQKPSMPCLGGPDLDTLYVTSIGNGGTMPMTPDQPLAGGLFACQPGTKGLAEPLFGGQEAPTACHEIAVSRP